MRMFLPLGKYPTAEPRTALFQRIEERLRGVSAIQAAAITSNPPMFGGFLRQLSVDGRPTAPGERSPEVTMVSISAGYFDTLGVRLVRGRTFDAADGTPGHESALVNQRFVAMHFSGEDPLGRRITLDRSGAERSTVTAGHRDDRRVVRPFASATSRTRTPIRSSTCPIAPTRSASSGCSSGRPAIRAA